MLKREEIQNPNSCLNKAADDEPVFVLRAQDKLSPMIVRTWAFEAELRGTPKAKTEEALAQANAMESWALAHLAKYPD